MEFNFEEWEDKKVVMHCSTKEEAEDFCRVMDEAGKDGVITTNINILINGKSLKKILVIILMKDYIIV